MQVSPDLDESRDAGGETICIARKTCCVDSAGGCAADNREWIRRAPRQHGCNGAQNPDLIGGSGASPTHDRPHREARSCGQCSHYHSLCERRGGGGNILLSLRPAIVSENPVYFDRTYRPNR